MDFDDTPEEAAFRAEAQAFLEAHASLKTGSDTDWSRGAVATDPAVQAEYLRHTREWQATLFDNGWAGIAWPKAFGGRGGTPSDSIIFNQEARRYDVTTGFIGAAQSAGRPTDHAPRQSGRSRPATSGRCSAATSCGASCSASRAPAATWPRWRPGRCSTVTSGSSTGRRCGPRRPTTPTTASSSPAPIPTRPSTAASPSSSSTCTRRASTSGRWSRRPGSRTSTRCS